MGIGSRLGETEPGDLQYPNQIHNTRRKLIFILSVTLIVSSSAIGLFFVLRPKSSSNLAHTRPTQAISRTCGKTRYQSLCVNSLLDFPGSLTASDTDLIHISVNLTLQRVGRAFYSTNQINNLQMNKRLRSAYNGCLELLEDSIDQLSRSLFSVAPSAYGQIQQRKLKPGGTHDVMTWLSAALTNQVTCMDGLAEVEDGNKVKNQMKEKLMDLSELVSNCLAIYSAANGNNDFAGVPIQNRRRRRLMSSDENVSRFPQWLSRRERKLLEMPVTDMVADVVVSKGGENGTVKTISEALMNSPEHSDRRFIIYVRAGRYEEKNLVVGRRNTNIMLVGDGKGKTIISGGVSIFDNVTTFQTASFAARGTGFVARDITFVNWAGPDRHQAVALRVGSDKAVIYRCSIEGYQDTLYVHSQRQFFRECDIYGTVDFIFGDAAVVFQNCSIYARKPMDQQKNTITAQNREDPNQITGISIHACRIVATPDLEVSKANFSTYLGRPWKLYSRTVIMLSFIDDHIQPSGWLEWNETFALDTLYYGEYMNYGPGGAVGQRVTWPGFRVITTVVEAAKFSVENFIYGSSWLPSTGVAYSAGLSE